MLNYIIGALTKLSSGSEDSKPEALSPQMAAIMSMLNLSDFARPEFQSALMAQVALQADGAKIDFDKFRSFTSGVSILSKYREDLEKQLISWVEKIAKAGGKAAAQGAVDGAIESLHLQEFAFAAFMGLVHIIFYACCMCC